MTDEEKIQVFDSLAKLAHQSLYLLHHGDLDEMYQSEGNIGVHFIDMLSDVEGDVKEYIESF